MPEIIEVSGKTCETEILSNEKYFQMLDKKLDEELAEYHQEQSIEELADFLEVLYATAIDRGYSIAELEHVRVKKQKTLGGFNKGNAIKVGNRKIVINMFLIRLKVYQ